MFLVLGLLMIHKFTEDINMSYVSATKLGGIISIDWAFKKISTKVGIMGL